ncbi:kielin/chordin-like protein [Plakobranchus ocellatus]|uniref:Kielin/chordin-like protein n=1 Tax=Plakobranchus ocellatus TaxID=259542 RepID=A0AAV3YTQ7_9GAST|nr:kielin/chordin-like protein [Plakobranchus ocellatus]
MPLSFHVLFFLLQSAPFTRCHRVVPPGPYLSSCVYDLCVCMENPDCLCNIVATYAHECARAGVKVQWRTQDMCAFSCDASKGLVFDECGPVCPRTCESLQALQVLHGASDANSTSSVSGSGVQYPDGQSCFKPCVASCQCTADKVLHGGECISPEDCPRVEKMSLL